MSPASDRPDRPRARSLQAGGSRAERWIDALSDASMMPIPASCRAGVAGQFVQLMLQARLLMAGTLPDDAEPASFFTPSSAP